MRYSRTRLSTMDVADQLTVVGRSALAAALGFVIGLERETRGKAAGERTFALLSLGAAAFVSIGVFLFPSSADRIVQGIAAGVGFLGGGVIFRHKTGVQGLTTAAGAWAAAAIGVVAGLGAFVAAALATAVVLIILEVDQIPFLRRMSEQAEAAASANPRDRDHHEHQRPRARHDRGP
jgi:putative Mg2+ transporter-C (MgtC) family protein